MTTEIDDEATVMRSYGFMIQRKQDSLGTVSLTAEVMVREGDKAHPLNPSGDGEGGFYKVDVPKKTLGLHLDGLVIRSYQSTDRGKGDLFEVYQPDVYFADSHRVDYRKAMRMAKTLKRVNDAINKANVREHGDVLMAVAKAIGATWYVERLSKHGSSYSDNEWRFGPLEYGRDKFRQLVEDARHN
jgi:hypothetical protein